MICDDCKYRAEKKLTGLVYCIKKHIECAIKKDDTVCSSYKYKDDEE